MEHEINDRERRCIRRAMLKDEAEKRKRLMDEQRLLQSQRDEYIMNIRRKREEANRQEEYSLGLARAEEVRRRSLFSTKTLCCDPSLEPSWRDSSTEGSHLMFLWRNIGNHS